MQHNQTAKLNTEIVIPIRNSTTTIILRPPSWLLPYDVTLLQHLLQNRTMISIAKNENVNIKTLYSRKKALYQKLDIGSDLTFFRDLLLRGTVTLEE